ncbi:hypothetical protein [Lacipirellula sp.]|uniref:hypothetical protein n=1 Tax=Lacipirellula sp. TaxID=2691419 RepID=UPI003D0FE964
MPDSLFGGGTLTTPSADGVGSPRARANPLTHWQGGQWLGGLFIQETTMTDNERLEQLRSDPFVLAIVKALPLAANEQIKQATMKVALAHLAAKENN